MVAQKAPKPPERSRHLFLFTPISWPPNPGSHAGHHIYLATTFLARSMIPAFAPLRYTCLTKSSFFHTIPGTGPRSQALGHHKRKDWHIALVRAFWPRRPAGCALLESSSSLFLQSSLFSVHQTDNCAAASGRPEMTSLSPRFYRLAQSSSHHRMDSSTCLWGCGNNNSFGIEKGTRTDA